MLHISIDLHARHFGMAVLNQDDSTIFEETLPTSYENLKWPAPICGTSCYVSPRASRAMATELYCTGLAIS